ncbi:MAG TPA: AI-2E family transporter [Chloroflexaceae bacterium]|nr:AI-2E family transporter [Chloroflexaceae bacterium]
MSAQTQPGRHPQGGSFARRALTAVGIGALVAALLLMLWSLVEVLLVIFAAVLFAVFLDGLRRQISERTPITPGWALAIITVGLLVLVALGVWLLAPGVGRQIAELEQTLPASLAALERLTHQYGWLQALLDETPPPTELMPGPAELLARATGIFSSALAALLGVLLVFVVALYLAATPRLYVEGLLRLVPVDRRPRARQVLEELGRTLWWWLVGRLLSMLAVGLMTALGLWLLGVPLALTLGLLAALLDFIPNVGPVLAALPGVLLALLQGPEQALAVLVLYIVIQQIESYLITPIVQQQTVKLPPALSILAVVLLGVLVGPLGLVLAAPIAAVALVLVRTLYVEDILGDAGPPDEPPPPALVPAPAEVGKGAVE